MKRFVLVCVAMLGTSCSAQVDITDLQLAPSLAGTAISSVDSGAIATLRTACPGLQRYYPDMLITAIEHDPSGASEIEVKVSDAPANVPFDFYATGHTCRFKVGGLNPVHVEVAKRPCVMACKAEKVDVPSSTLITIQ